MDRRQKRTRKAIFDALGELLIKKRFDNITVQEIIDAANIGRSTFYAHFETKDNLLKEMCTDIFEHIFKEELPQESDHDFSGGSADLKAKLIHTLYHLRENKSNLKGIMNGESGELFMRYLKSYLQELFGKYKDDFSSLVPEDFLLNHLSGSFAEAIKWWMVEDTKHCPEDVISFYMTMIGHRK